ncbi:hypothetical protein HDU81_008534 [Chytriomyces hyalinus]|nr:hypothetical protein HDU81_008534 [Chytriomyces hyalinus]
MDPYCAFHSNARNNMREEQENSPPPFIVPSPPPRNRTATGLRLPLKRTPSIQSKPQYLPNTQNTPRASPPTSPSKDRNVATRQSFPVPSRIPTAATPNVPVRQPPPPIHRTSLPVPVPRNRSSFVFKIPSASDLRTAGDLDLSESVPLEDIRIHDDVMEEVVDEELTMEELAVADGDDTVCGDENQTPVEVTPVEETPTEDPTMKSVDVAVEKPSAEEFEVESSDPVVEEIPTEDAEVKTSDPVIEEGPAEDTEEKTSDPVVEIQFVEEEVEEAIEEPAKVVEETAAITVPAEAVPEERPAKLEISFETENSSPIDSNDSVKNDQPSPTTSQTPLDKYIESTSSRNFNSSATVEQDEDAASLISYDFHGSDGMTSIAPSIMGAASNFEPLSNHLHPPSRFSTAATAAHRRRARKPIDMTNLTLLHHLLTTRISDMQTHHAALLHHPSRYSNTSSNEQQQLLRSHHKSSYLNSAREIIFLGKGIAKSWQPVARGCRDKWLGERLLLSLQRIDTLSAQMKGVLGSHVRNSSSADVDAEGTVLCSAVEVVKAAEGALRDLEAVSVKAFEKDTPDAGENDENAEVDQLGDLVSLKNGLSERELAVRKRRSYAESLLDYGEDDGASAVEFSGMEGMQEALNIAMRAAEKVE